MGQNGIVQSAWWDQDAGWNNWFSLDFDCRFADNAPITALARRPDHLDIFLVDQNGAVTSAWFHEPTPEEIQNNVSPWRPWFNIDPNVHFRQDRPVSAIAREPEHIDLFAIGFDGAVYSTFWQLDQQGWRNWFIVHGETRFPKDAYVTALSRRPDHIDVFAVGPGNNVWSCWWHADGQQWRSWFVLFPQRAFRPDQPIAAVARQPEHIDLFVMGYDGAVWSAWWDAASGWHEWFQIHPEMRFDAQATVTAVARRPDHLDIYVKQADGSVWATFWHADNQGWRAWYGIHPEVRFDPKRKVTALARRSEQLDLFDIDASGAVVSTFWPGFAPDAPLPDVQHAIYLIDDNGNLIWERHLDAWNGGGDTSWLSQPVDSGWEKYLHAFAAGEGILYAVLPNGDLIWNKHLGYIDGRVSWSQPQKVGNGWQDFKRIFSDRQGHIYAIGRDGNLYWYDHKGWHDGTPSWSRPSRIGNGWENFLHVFAGGRGIIYAVQPDGQLLWYRHNRPSDGVNSWLGPEVVGSGWNKFTHVFAGPEGTIYGLQPDGNLLWYRHHGLDSGVFLWSGPKWTRSGKSGLRVVL